jgi:soluble lytic murein transglycosylase-like protein
VRRRLCYVAFAVLTVVMSACGGQASADSTQAASMPSLPPITGQLNGDPGPPPAASVDISAPPLDLRVTKSMIYAAAMDQHVNPYLAMGLGWWESGWNESAVSSAGAIGVMQIMPATAAVSGPWLLRRQVNLNDINDNIELGCAILRNNLGAYHGDLVKALTDYYGGPTLVADWGHLRPDAQRYVWGIYHLALAFQAGRGPV